MNSFITLYIPDQPDLQDLANLYEHKLARRFGGCTTTQGKGAWINGQDHIQREPVLMITSWFNVTEQVAADVLTSQFAHDLRKAGEEAIFIVRNGEALIL